MAAERKLPMALCPACGTPLIPTLAFRGAEFYCLECGRQWDFIGPRPAAPTAELNARYEALKAEWDQHAAGKLLPDGGWLEACAACRPRGEPHTAHATAEEWAAHDAAIAWLDRRAAQEASDGR